MLLGIGASIDYGQLYAKRTALQAAADAAALGAAKELQLANRSEREIATVAKSLALSNAGEMPGTIKVATKIINDPLSLAVELTQSSGLYFMGHVMGNRDSVIKARAVARVMGSIPVCALGLEKKASNTISMEHSAHLSAPKCAVYSNSSNKKGIETTDDSVLEAGLICSSGGIEGSKESFNPAPLTDCPRMDDPLAARRPPIVGKCDFKDLRIQKETRTLHPGVYCGGLLIDNESEVHLAPGIYVIKNGNLRVKDAALFGENVGFYLVGKGARFSFEQGSTIRLTAPNNGEMAGLLFFEGRNVKLYQQHKILSNDARLLLGTIYLPRGMLYVEAKSAIADQSAYTVIIAQRFELREGPTLVLNTDYDSTDIPVPEGVSLSGTDVVLMK